MGGWPRWCPRPAACGGRPMFPTTSSVDEQLSDAADAVDAALAELESLKAVARGKGGAVTLTAQGRQFAKTGQALQLAEHKVLSLLYRAGLDDLQLWSAQQPAPTDLPVLPGLLEGARQG